WKDLILEHLGQAFWNSLLILQTPRPGFAVITRCPTGVEKSQKLAWAPNPKFLDADDPEFIVMIETKGEGGYCLLPGSPASCHKTGRRYEILQGSFKKIPDLTAEQREVFLACARSFDQKPREQCRPQIPRTRIEGELTPGDDYNLNGPDWRELLRPHGY